MTYRRTGHLYTGTDRQYRTVFYLALTHAVYRLFTYQLFTCIIERGATILYREPLTVYRLEGQVLSLVSNQSHVSQTDSSRKYTWSTSPKVYIKIIEERWLGERATVEYMNKTYDGVKVRYTVPLTTNNTFKSEWATLRLGGL